MTNTKKPPIAGQILPVPGGRMAIIGERLEDVLDLSTWSEVENTTVPRSPAEDAKARAQLEAWEAAVRTGVAAQKADRADAERARLHGADGPEPSPDEAGEP